MPIRLLIARGSAAGSRPNTDNSPPLLATTPYRQPIKVDLPAPFGTSKPMHSPSKTSKSQPCNATTSPKRFVTPRATMTLVSMVVIAFKQNRLRRERQVISERPALSKLYLSTSSRRARVEWVRGERWLSHKSHESHKSHSVAEPKVFCSRRRANRPHDRCVPPTIG